MVEARDECTGTEIVGSGNYNNKVIDNYFLGRSKISKQWKMDNSKNSPICIQNVVIYLHGVKGSAKLVKSYKECWEYFFDIVNYHC